MDSRTILIVLACSIPNIVTYMASGGVTLSLCSGITASPSFFFITWISHTVYIWFLPLAIFIISTKCNNVKNEIFEDDQAQIVSLLQHVPKSRSHGSFSAASHNTINLKSTKDDIAIAVINNQENGNLREIFPERESLSESNNNLEISIRSLSFTSIILSILNKSKILKKYFDDNTKRNIFNKYLSQLFILTLLYILITWLWTRAICQSGMSLGTVTAIYNSHPLFIYIYSCFTNKYSNNLYITLIAILLALFGVTMFAYHSSGEPSSFIGVLMALACSIMFATYEIIFASIESKNKAKVPLEIFFLFLGSMGILYTFIFWIPIYIFHLFSFEIFALPTPSQWLLLAINAIIVAVYQLSLQISLTILPSPLFVSLASLACMPIADILDVILQTGVVSAPDWIGTFMVAAAFLIIWVQEMKGDVA